MRIFLIRNIYGDMSNILDFRLIPNQGIPVCRSKSGTACDIPFVYQGQQYDTCVNVDSGGSRWCYTNVTDKKWEICRATSCEEPNGMTISADKSFNQYLIKLY